MPKEIGHGNKETDQVYLAIQMANDLAIHTLKMAGYDAQWLKATLKKKKVVEELICVPNTVARQERLAIARGHGKQFQATNSMNITDNDIFIAFKMKDRAAARAAAKKDKKRQQQQQMNEEKALKILSQEGKGLKLYLVKDLDILLAWHQVKDLPPKPKKEDKLARWRQILVSMKPPPLYERWTNEDEQQLVALHSDVIGIEDTMFGREVTLKKREMEAAASHFNWEESKAMQQKFDAMDAAKANAAKAIAQCVLETAAAAE